jgi:Arm DNA-binding domain
VKEGTVIRRGKTWSVVLDLGKGPDGKRIRKWHSGFETERDAKRARRQLLAALDRGAYVAPSKRTTGVFLREHWLPGLRARSGRAHGPSINPRLRFTSSRPSAGYSSNSSPLAT